MQISKSTFLATLAAVLVATQLVSCGGGSSNSSSNAHITEVVSFGTSLSDAGTYAPATYLSAGVKFTTNPAPLWNEIVANAYGLSITPNEFARFDATGADLSLNILRTSPGDGYAQGSALVSAPAISPLMLTGDNSANAPSAKPLLPTNDPLAPGLGTGYPAVAVVPAGPGDVIVGYSFYPHGTPVVGDTPFAAKSGVPTALTAVSIKDQISNYLATHNDQFSANQLVTIEGGANDLFMALSTYAAHGNINADPNYCGRSVFPADPTDNLVTCAAKEMALQLQRLVDKGATNILYANMPDVGNTPDYVLYALADPVNGPPTQAMVTQLSGAYNAVVAGSLHALNIDTKITVFDTQSFFTNTLASPPSGTVANPNAKFACRAPASSTDPITKVTALGCTSLKDSMGNEVGYVSADAPTTYIFADGVHPTLLGHQLWGNAAAAQALAAFPR